MLRAELEQHFGMAVGALDNMREELKAVATSAVEALTGKRSQPHQDVEDLGEEDRHSSRVTYLVTFSKVSSSAAASTDIPHRAS